MGARDRSEGPGMRSAPDAFVGRQPELDQIITLLLCTPRLVTLLGPGGIGKTRLASEAVARFQRSTGVEAHWARLARLAAGADATAVAEEIAHAVLEIDFSGRSAWEAIVDALAGPGEQVVLVLDNCEHVLDGVGTVVNQLTAELPNLTIVATSREAIGWIDEHRVPVPPLSREHGIALFQQRSELIGRSVIRPDQAEIMAEICRHVNNHPLFIRLAAARLVREPLPMILRELSGEAPDDQRLRWSDGPRVGADARHRGVRDVISWSYELCDEQERILFERMAVFAAGYDTNPEDVPDGAALDVGAEREAIEFVCSDPAGDGPIRLPRSVIPDLLDRLVDQSLVSAHLTATTVRYSLLESIRVFAQQRLELRSRDGLDERARLERRHRQYYRDKVVDAATNWFGAAELQYLDWARAAWDNILTAIDRSLAEPGQAAVGLDICRGLLAIRLPFLGCSFREIRLWSARTLQATRLLAPEPTENQLETTALVVWIALCQGTLAEAEAMLDECVRTCLGEGSDLDDWRASAETDLGLTAAVEFAWGVELLIARSDPRSIIVLSRAAEKYRRGDDVGGSVMAELFGALAAGLLGTVEQADAVTASFLARVEGSGASWVHSWARLARTVALVRADQSSEALTLGRSALTHLTKIRDRWGELWAVQFRTWALARLIEQAQQAKADRPRLVAAATEIAQLAGGTKVLLAETNMDVSRLGPFSAETVKAVTAARAVLGETAYAAAEKQGLGLRPERGELQSFALGSLSLYRPRAEDVWTSLSPAEGEVAILAAAGWTNSAIAVRRGISTRTVDAQVASVLQKLAIGSRAEIGELAPRPLRDRMRAESMRAPGRQPGRRGT
ncbi:ATP-binding protein [Nocardia colli]|uniref:ATP-binding protein n=1 Tax=Nocardia colli TaxID=2545717 RepID=UPI0035DA1AAF